MQKEIYRHLVYKKKRHGRVLSKAFPEFGLPKFARLMPSIAVPDVEMFEFTTPPFPTSWWVGHPDARVLHDCPLTMLQGVGLHMWSLDLMHGWHLGPMQMLISLAINFCLDTGLWAPKTDLDAEDRKRIGLLAIKAELVTFYKLKSRDPDWAGKSSEVTAICLDLFLWDCTHLLIDISTPLVI